MNYKVGDKVRIKSLEWYKNNCDLYGNIVFPREDEEDIEFDPLHAEYCGQIMTISSIVYGSRYIMEDDIHESEWTDEMIEGLVEEEVFIKANDIYNEEYSKGEYCHEQSFKWGFQEGYNYSHENDKLEISLKEGYQFTDENGNVINAQKIVLEKKKNEYPKTYEECCVDLGLKVCPKVNVSIGDTPTYREHIVETFIELLACRDAYLKRYEIEMKLNSRWTPDYEDLNTTKFCITTSRDKVIKVESSVQNYVLAFPTEEMRDAFYENFKELIERCKELL